jgi:hypothetical protein
MASGGAAVPAGASAEQPGGQGGGGGGGSNTAALPGEKKQAPWSKEVLVSALLRAFPRLLPRPPQSVKLLSTSCRSL